MTLVALTRNALGITMFNEMQLKMKLDSLWLAEIDDPVKSAICNMLLI